MQGTARVALADCENSTEMLVAWHRIHLTTNLEYQRADAASQSGRTGHSVEEEEEEEEEGAGGRHAEEQSRPKVNLRLRTYFTASPPFQ